jgi:hypothetical protein
MNRVGHVGIDDRRRRPPPTVSTLEAALVDKPANDLFQEERIPLGTRQYASAHLLGELADVE